MNSHPRFVINKTEEFIHLSRAPITEAVIEIRVVLESPWDENQVESQLKERLPEYPVFTSQKEFKQEFQFGVSSEAPAKQTFKDMGLKGFRFKSEDNHHIAQFNRDGFVFSRLQPYADWQEFITEALRLWQIYSELTRPRKALRIGLRFINRLACPLDSFELTDYLRIVPVPPIGLDVPFAGFLHHETLTIPEHPYLIKIVKTTQPPQGPEGKDVGLIIDIDVLRNDTFDASSEIIKGYLEEMRWLKNKAFFGSITDSLMEVLR
ncbi:MAG: TIGR04255 family protein [Syntrophorhabdaceae bacterium]|nr:TIGR04255 family protein [Syntrophorhabdaceae bacterium]